MIDPYILKNASYITSHKLKEFIRCPFCFKKKHIDLVPSPRQETPDYFVVGQAFDDYMTYGQEEYCKKYEVVARRGVETGRTQLTKGQGETIEALLKGYNLNPFFDKKVSKKILEGEIFGVKVRGELDHFVDADNMIVDIKTTANLFKFDPLSYIYQMAFYHLLMEEIEDRRCSVRLYVCEKDTEVPKSECYEFSQESLMEGRRQVLQDMVKYVDALEHNEFPPTTDRYTLLTSCEYYGVEGHGIQSHIITI